MRLVVRRWKITLHVNVRAADAAELLSTLNLVHSLAVGGIVEKLYDVLMLPGVQRSIALGSKTDDTRRVISI